MYHTIEFRADRTVDLEIDPRHRLERLRVRRGYRTEALVKPYVVERPDGPVEVADLFFADGTITRAMPFALFSFVE